VTDGDWVRMVEADGEYVSVYDKPPSPHFFTVRLVTGGDITKHRAAMNMPLYWLLSYADAKIRENTPDDADKPNDAVPDWVQEWNDSM
jgi:hypothetical protein